MNSANDKDNQGYWFQLALFLYRTFSTRTATYIAIPFASIISGCLCIGLFGVISGIFFGILGIGFITVLSLPVFFLIRKTSVGYYQKQRFVRFFMNVIAIILTPFMVTKLYYPSPSGLFKMVTRTHPPASVCNLRGTKYYLGPDSISFLRFNISKEDAEYLIGKMGLKSYDELTDTHSKQLFPLISVVNPPYWWDPEITSKTRIWIGYPKDEVVVQMLTSFDSNKSYIYTLRW